MTDADRTRDVTAIVVGPEHDGQRLDVVAAAGFDLPRSQIAARLRADDVTVDGRAAKASHKVREGQRVELARPVVVPPAPPPPVPPIRYRDDHLLVVSKPAGLVVHPGAGHATGTLVDALRAEGIALAPAGGEGRPGIVHRLDRDTSGLLVVASTDAVHGAMVDALRRRVVTRRYVALVDGVPADPVGRIEAPIGRDPDRRTRFATVPEGKPAITRYTAVARGTVGERPVTLLVCQLESGRTHQIRVHLTAIGHPVLGDPVYGPRPTMSARLELTRPFLHAARLAFDHPATGERIDLVEPLPEDLVEVLSATGIPPRALDELVAD